MNLVFPDAEQASRRAAEIIATAVRENPEIVLGLATGATPVETYRQLVRMHRQEGLDFGRVTTFNLDEYIGLGADHPCSFHTFMRRNLFDHVNLDSSRIHIPNGLADDPASDAQRYEESIKSAGGIDLQLLGIGHNGHIAFNEPGSPVDSRTRVVQLTADTIEKNSRFFDSIDDVPRAAVTMGIGTVMEARRILLLAFGSGKADAVSRAINGEMSIDHPATLLQSHPDVTFLLDQSAAALLS